MIEGLDQMLCSCGSFSTMWQCSSADLESCLLSEYWVTTGRTGLQLGGSVEKRVARLEESFGDIESGDF